MQMVKLDPKIIVREESQCYLLYNGQNLGLISVSKEAYDRCIIQNRCGNEDNKFRNWLFKNNFLTEKPISHTKEHKNQLGDDVPQTASTFYDIKSERSPLNILWALITQMQS